MKLSPILYRSLRIFIPGILVLGILLVPLLGAVAQTRIESTDPALRLQWFEEHMAMKETSLFTALKWRNLEPHIISGRCTDIAVPTGEQHTIYVGAASGGLWKTVNSGITWEPIMEDLPTSSIGDIAVAPTNPNIVWVGTGEANIFRSSVAGIGIYKSTDAGKTWTDISSNVPGGPVNVIRENPTDEDILYVGTDLGVYVTINGGNTWHVLANGLPTCYVWDLIVHPRDMTLVIATHGRGMYVIDDVTPIQKYEKSPE